MMGKIRVSLKYKNPNPLFIKWMQELIEEANKIPNNKSRFVYERALRSLEKYPLPFKSGKDCIILQHFGAKICKYLDKKLQEHNETEGALAAFTNFPSIGVNVAKGNFKKQLDNDGTHRRIESMVSNTKFAERMNDDDEAIGLISLSSSSDTEIQSPHKISSETGNPTNIQKHRIFQYETFKPTSSQLSVGEIEALDQNKLLFHSDTQISPKKQKLTKSPKKQSKIKNKEKAYTKTLIDEASSRVHTDKSNEPAVETDMEKTTKFIYNFSKLILLVDTAETIGKSKTSLDQTLKMLNQLKVEYEVKRLAVGDFLWVVRDQNGEDYVLPYIIERKRIDDLACSIKDGRFHEQKFRLKHSGIANIIYLIECYTNERMASLPISTLTQAAINTNVHSNFSVKYTDSHDHSMLYISTMHDILKTRCKAKTFMLMSHGTDLEHLSIESSIVPVLEFNKFNKQSSKQRNCTIREIFIKQLLQLKNLTLEKALSITEIYPTPKSLNLAYQNCASITEGEKLLAHIQFGKLRKNIGISISKILYKLFTITDPL